MATYAGTVSRPANRRDFEIAIICALPLEADAANALFDHSWDDDGPPYDKAPGDPNAYSTGTIGRHNVVLAHMPGMGTNSAAIVAAACRMSFTNIKLALVVGICGAIPHRPDGQEIVLGDVIISDGVVQYDFGRHQPEEFKRKDTLLDSLGRPNLEIRAFVNKLKGLQSRKKLQSLMTSYLGVLQREPELKATYLGPTFDRLFDATYRHIGGEGTCDEVGCNGDLVPRSRLQPQPTFQPMVHFGLIASGNTVMKSGEDRDRIAAREGVIGFEMESAGVWDNFPCVVIKGICDYADSHKSKGWQRYAAATAAACMKAFLTNWVPSNPEPVRSHFLVPFGENEDFVGRETILEQLLERIPPNIKQNDCQRTAVEGLGGVGKTQVALQAAYRVRAQYPDCSVFWVPAISPVAFENTYREIGQTLQVPGIDKENADIKGLVKTALEKSVTSWLLIIDNIDDLSLLTGEMALRPYLPFSRRGSILFTTRNRQVTAQLDIPKSNIIKVAQMDDTEALTMLRNGLEEYQFSDSQSTEELLEYLVYLPLAIKQASAYMAATGETTTDYLEHCHTSKESEIELLNTEFEDRYRYPDNANPIATTWLISFQHLIQSAPLAISYLRFICFLAEKNIPVSLLPPGKNKQKENQAIGILEGYAFIIMRGRRESFDMHRLVRLATRNWLRQKWKDCCTYVIQHLSQVYPWPEHENREIWMEYMPHAQAGLEVRKDCTDENATVRLLTNIGWSSYRQGKYAEAEVMHRQALELLESVLGRDHPSTLGSMMGLASVLDNQGKYTEAEVMHRQTLELLESVLGRDHPSTLGSMMGLACVLDNQGKYTEAEVMHRQTLELLESVLGRDHPSTLGSMMGLANVLDNQGKYTEAEVMHRQTLELKESVLGRDHPDTLGSMNNLANVLDNQGKYTEAEVMHRQTLELRESVLGRDHPSTLSSMNNLAISFKNQGKYAEAEVIHRQTLELKESVLGRDHPSTLSSMNNLASVLDNQGKYTEAEVMHRQTLELLESVLGRDHPSTLRSMNNLAESFRQQGKYTEAEVMHRQTLELRELVLGRDHPDTLGSINALALTYHGQKRYEESEKLQKQALQGQEQKLGTKHPRTFESRGHVANALREQ
ncbi:hypothetical protein BX600DRAFT_522911 [Xylariales sp. PMI_506]|nr:hypothetical protein BX600DRAFT_522911 [Xylariales sp. PMI_506]